MEEKLNEKTVEVILPNEMGYERVAMACSASFAKIFGLLPERIEDLKTIVGEAAINAMQHGNKGRPDARVSVTLKHEDDAINVWVMDEGDGIKQLLPDPNIERIIDNLDPPIGFGTFFIKQLADHVEFNETTDKGLALKIVVKIKK
ncbi:MAG: ATP-binding protein [Desulfobacterales bacterium]|jgi:serine/threonine-protein kinase RsbW